MTAVNIGLGANFLLAVLKTSIGVIGRSPALLADGINSSSDVMYYLVVLVFMRLSQKPADKEHPFGHQQLESIAAVIVGAFVMTTAVSIFWDAIRTIVEQVSGKTAATAAEPIAFWAALFTVVVKIGLYFYTRAVGKQRNNVAVAALAYDHRNDIFAASAALLGITFGRAGATWVDPLAAALVALVILRTGIHILSESANDLMEIVPERRMTSQVMDVLMQTPGICEVEELHARRFGPYLVLNLTIRVDGSLKVSEGDEISTLAETRLKQQMPFIRAVHIHYHPQ